jgi:hypothetical protein
MITPTTGAVAIGSRALVTVGRHPRLLALLCGVHLLFALLGWGLAALLLGRWLAGRPVAGLPEWALLVRGQPGAALHAVVAAACVVLGYWLAESALATIVLRRQRGLPALSRWTRCWVQLALLRLLVALAAAALLAGWWLSAGRLYHLSLCWTDDRIHVVIQLSVALCFALPLLFVLLLGHFAQPLVAVGQTAHWALRGSLALLRRRTVMAAALYLLGWGMWGALATLGWGDNGGGLVIAQLVMVARVALHLWTCAAAWALLETA